MSLPDTEELPVRKKNSHLPAILSTSAIVISFICFCCFIALRIKRSQDVINKLHVSVYRNSGDFINNLKGDVTLINDSDSSVKDLVVICQALSASNIPLHDLSHTIYELLPPHSKKTVKDIDFGLVDRQAENFNCVVDDAVIINPENRI